MKKFEPLLSDAKCVFSYYIIYREIEMTFSYFSSHFIPTEVVEMELMESDKVDNLGILAVESMEPLLGDQVFIQCRLK